MQADLVKHRHPYFAVDRMRDLDPLVRAEVTGLLEPVLEQGEGELVCELALPAARCVLELLTAVPDSVLGSVRGALEFTAATIRNALHWLAAAPEVQERLRQDPGLIPEAIEERFGRELDRCPCAPLARLELLAVVEEIVRSTRSFRLSEPEPPARDAPTSLQPVYVRIERRWVAVHGMTRTLQEEH